MFGDMSSGRVSMPIGLGVNIRSLYLNDGRKKNELLLVIIEATTKRIRPGLGICRPGELHPCI